MLDEIANEDFSIVSSDNEVSVALEAASLLKNSALTSGLSASLTCWCSTSRMGNTGSVPPGMVLPIWH